MRVVTAQAGENQNGGDYAKLCKYDEWPIV